MKLHISREVALPLALGVVELLDDLLRGVALPCPLDGEDADAFGNELAAATDYVPSGGAFRNPLGRLRTLGLVSGRGDVRLAEALLG